MDSDWIFGLAVLFKRYSLFAVRCYLNISLEALSISSMTVS